MIALDVTFVYIIYLVGISVFIFYKLFFFHIRTAHLDIIKVLFIHQLMH